MGALRVLHVPVDDEPRIVDVQASDGDSHLNGLQALVGGYIEGIDGISQDREWEGFANEEGLLRQMPYNHTASDLARRLGWRGDGLVGPVVFTGPTDGNGDSTDVEAWLLEEAGVSDYAVDQP